MSNVYFEKSVGCAVINFGSDEEVVNEWMHESYCNVLINALAENEYKECEHCHTM